MTRLRLDEPRERGRPGAYAAYTALTFELADPLRQLDDALQRRPLELTTTRWCRRQQR